MFCMNVIYPTGLVFEIRSLGLYVIRIFGRAFIHLSKLCPRVGSGAGPEEFDKSQKHLFLSESGLTDWN